MSLIAFKGKKIIWLESSNSVRSLAEEENEIDDKLGR